MQADVLGTADNVIVCVKPVELFFRQPRVPHITDDPHAAVTFQTFNPRADQARVVMKRRMDKNMGDSMSPRQRDHPAKQYVLVSILYVTEAVLPGQGSPHGEYAA